MQLLWACTMTQISRLPSSLILHLCKYPWSTYGFEVLIDDSSFYVSYLALEFPHGYGMQRLPTAKYLGAAVILWGLVTALTCVCKNYGALVVTRVLLGCFESAVAPSLILITSMWYKKNEQPLRTGIWYLGVGMGTIIGSLISFGFQHYYSPTFTSWQIMFLVVGLVTVAVGIAGSTTPPAPHSPANQRSRPLPPRQSHVFSSHTHREILGHRTPPFQPNW